MKREKVLFDPRCLNLAEHFLRDVEGANGDDFIELAKAIQETVETFCSDLEEWRK